MNRSNMTGAKSVAVFKIILIAITLVIFSSSAKAACDPADYSKETSINNIDNLPRLVYVLGI